MATFRKRPDTIEAVQFDATEPESREKLLAFLGADPGSGAMPTVGGEECYWQTRNWEDEVSPFREALIVPRPGMLGDLAIQHCDWVVRHPGGKLERLSHAAFAALYEPVETAASPAPVEPAADAPAAPVVTDGGATTDDGKGVEAAASKPAKGEATKEATADA